MTTINRQPSLAELMEERMTAMHSAGSMIPGFRLRLAEEDVARYLSMAFEVEVAKTGKRIQRTAALNEAFATAAHWLVSPERVGLKIMGKPGTGKSTLVNAMREVIIAYYQTGMDRECPGLIIEPALLIADRCLRGDAEMSITAMIQKRALAIDDLGLEPTTVKYYGSELMPIRDIVHQRINNNAITVIATNLNQEEIRVKYGERLCDRLRDMTTILLDGQSHRTNK